MIFRYVRKPSKPVKPANPKNRFHSYKPLRAPMRVCQKWHRLISQDATLWNEINLVKYDAAGTMVQRLLERSKAATLDVRFVHPGSMKDGDMKITSFLKAHACRFGALGVILRTHRTSMMLPLLDVSMPRLACLVVSRYADTVSPVNVHEMSFKNFPALKALALSGTVLRPKEPIPSLTHLHLVALARDSVLPLLDMLRAAPSLEVLDLRLVQLNTSGVEMSSLELPRLRVLRLTGGTWSSVVHFLLTHIVAPNLAVADFSRVSLGHNIDNLIVYEYIPQTFFAERRNRLTRLSVSWHNNCFTATFASADSDDRIIIESSEKIYQSILDKPPLLDCLRNIEHACLDPGTDMERQSQVFWLVVRLEHAKSLVVGNLAHGLRLLGSNPVFVSELVSLTLDACYRQRDTDLVGSLAGLLQGRAKVAGPLPFLRLGAHNRELTKELEQCVDDVKKHVDTLEIVRFTSSKDAFWPAWFNRRSRRGDDHAYWDDSDLTHLGSY
ncbi:hypothetical protein L226DRAFT_615784 [Lentinus tigrinus ALCF2SS1-7]|uniref:F-box domain-containing protein n=1 Tax=Lentinus tigrinus ALCF2SS1-6 TaxID=1328759 RepID=A0A5C2RYY1_9APHY|nr:hypothetical protein L227DRAFT_283959 [Lentinus tigrinus ALCF2SS1-6]RPD71062.1 hypothetical protein L226DRAFT_615784 [Lentinus tigrinus ALCF2SS1-7]